jgi:hypothetical protein
VSQTSQILLAFFHLFQRTLASIWASGDTTVDFKR